MKNHSYNISYYDFLIDNKAENKFSINKYYNFESFSVSEFEKLMADYFGVKYAIATSSGTTALITSYMAIGVQGKKVAIPAFSFISPALAAVLSDAIIEFVDIDGQTLCIDIDEIFISQKFQNIDVIVPVHIGGISCNLNDLIKKSSEINAIVIEDAAQAFGSTHNNKKLGTFGRIGIFSFGKSKIPTAGEGGLILTNDGNIAERCYSLINYGRKSSFEPYIHTLIGFNGKMSDIQASYIISQMASFDELIKKRYENGKYLQENLVFNSLSPIKPRWNDLTNFYMLMFRYTPKSETYPCRNELVSLLLKKGIPVSAINKFPFPIYKNPCLNKININMKKCYKAEKVYEELIVIGHPGQSIILNSKKKYLDFIINVFMEVFKKFDDI